MWKLPGKLDTDLVKAEERCQARGGFLRRLAGCAGGFFGEFFVAVYVENGAGEYGCRADAGCDNAPGTQVVSSV